LGILRGMARLWGDPANGEICDACDKPITEPQLILDGTVSTRSDKKLAQFHVRCFQFGIWRGAHLGSDWPDLPERLSIGSISNAECRAALPRGLQTKFPGGAVILAIVGILLASSGVTSVGTIGPAIAGPAPAADAKPVVVRSRPEVQRSIRADRDKDPALGLVLLLGMLENRRGR
jgi:hypothetical protein